MDQGRRAFRAARLLAATALIACCVAAARADNITYDTPEGRRTAEGKLAARSTAEVLFLGRDGRMHLVDAARVVDLVENDEQPKPLTKKETVTQLRAEFGPRFGVYETANYLVCYSSDTDFAKSCGRLFEKLHGAFSNYFKERHVAVRPSGYPLVAVVFGSEHDFLQYAQRELGDEMARNVIGYYSFLSNRMVLFDMQADGSRAGLGNVATGRPGQGPRGIEAFDEVNIATIIHEATHQLAYNCGFHRRFSDNPLWLAEGMAMFFEAPNRRAGDWKGIGEVNRPRLELFRREILLGSRPADIQKLVSNDDLLRERRTALLAYAESWALTYFLMRTRSNQFFEYLKILGEKPPLSQDTPDQRLADFRAAFGADIDKLEEEFVRYMRGVR